MPEELHPIKYMNLATSFAFCSLNIDMFYLTLPCLWVPAMIPFGLCYKLNGGGMEGQISYAGLESCTGVSAWDRTDVRQVHS